MSEEIRQPLEMELTRDEMRPAMWVRLLDEMRERGVHYGAKFDRAFLEQRLQKTFGTLEFGADISCINDELARDGYFLSARDQNESAYVVVSPEQTEQVADGRVRRSFREVQRAIKLFNGVAHNAEAQLTEAAKKRLQSKAEKNALRLLLMKRPVQIAAKIPQKLLGQ